ncbi:MAG: peptidoglycan DD-metalloendopeptidase family protein [Emcibacter sp.]|nr:peptidoglycan DD-metalloendopeptidase family protein [Emcibacter sp.]
MTESSLSLMVGLCLMSGIASATPLNDDKNLKDIQDKIITAQERTKKFEEESKVIDEEIDSLRQKLILAAEKIQQTESQTYAKEDRLAEMNDEQITLEKALKSRYGQMAKTLAAMQRLSQQPAELVAYRPEKAINSLRSASLLKTLHPELKKRAEHIQKDMAELQSLKVAITAEQKELRVLLSALTSEQIAMNDLLEERNQKQEALRKATREERRKLKEFAAKAKNLQELIDRIEKEAQEREKAALAAAERLTDKPEIKEQDLAKTNRPRLDSFPSGSILFDDAKGNLPLPARGSIRRTFGSKTAEGLSSEGITIHTLPRATVVAPHEGRIVFAGKFRTYGKLLIIAHGQEYHTLLAGMTRMDVEVGQWVLKGEPVGQMSETVASLEKEDINTEKPQAGQNLYVELRKMGKPINPLPWIVASDRKVF